MSELAQVTPAATPAALECNHVAVRFGDYTALDDVTLSVPAGSFVTLIGPNGAGKSTLIKTVLGLIRPLAGEVRLFGQDPEAVPPADVGYVPQVKTLDRRFPAQSLELVATGVLGYWPGRIGAVVRQRALEALERCGAAHLARRPIGHLSGGETQRVYLARAVVRRPRLILLDEPAAGMDVSGEADMYQILEAYQRETGATVVMITHDWEASQFHASHVLLLNRRLVCFGRPDEALGDANLRRAFGHVGHVHPNSATLPPQADAHARHHGHGHNHP